MGTPALYTDRAELYDAIYHDKPYEAEAERLHDLLDRRGIFDGASVLEAACGTGSYLYQLQIWYRVAGFDRYEGMLAEARRKVPQVELFAADMAAFEVDRRFDAALCLFSSIGYLLTRERLEAAARCFARALRPGGVLVIEPFLSMNAFVSGRPVMQSFDSPLLKCTRACITKQVGDRAVLDFHWLVLRARQPEVEHFTERHELWLCPPELMTEVLEGAGFSVSRESPGLMKGRELLIAERNA